LTVIFKRAAYKPSHNNGCGPLPETNGHSWYTVSTGYITSLN